MHKGIQIRAMVYLFVSTMSLQAQAGHLQSKCVLAEASNEIVGQNVDKLLPIASVSKLFTTLWSVSAKGVDSKFVTRFYVTAAGSDTFDVHLQGAWDPYFSEQSWHYLISQLNKLNVFKIRNLTFDENFKFYFNPYGKQAIPGQHGFFNPVDSQRRLTDPSPELVKSILSNKKQWLVNYNKTFARYPGELVQKPRLAVQSIEFLPSSKFPAPLKVTGYIRSAELTTQLKMMNWNSNNHAANMFFYSLGGKPKFDKFMTENLKLKVNEFEFYNGSGNNNNFDGGAGVYNSATCSAVVRTIRALKQSLEKQKHSLEDVVAVAGADKGATVQRYSLNVHVNDAVIAKSGTITSNVALAGMVNTVKGKFYFAFNFATGALPKMRKPTAARVAAAMRAEWSKTRAQIGAELGKLVASLGGAKSIGYKAKSFELESFEDSDESISQADLDKQILAVDESNTGDVPNLL